MPTTRIEIEQVENSRWVAEVEVGGLAVRRSNEAGSSFADIIAAVQESYYEQRPDERPEPKLEAALKPKPKSSAFAITESALD